MTNECITFLPTFHNPYAPLAPISPQPQPLSLTAQQTSAQVISPSMDVAAMGKRAVRPQLPEQHQDPVRAGPGRTARRRTTQAAGRNRIAMRVLLLSRASTHRREASRGSFTIQTGRRAVGRETGGACEQMLPGWKSQPERRRRRAVAWQTTSEA